MSNSQSLNQIYENCKTKKGASTTERMGWHVDITLVSSQKQHLRKDVLHSVRYIW